MHFSLLLPSFRSLFKYDALFLFSLLSLIVLTSCSTPTKKAAIEKKPTSINEKKESKVSATQLVIQAKKSQPKQANSLLIEASRLYLLENKPDKALWLSEHLLTTKQTGQQQYNLTVIAATASFSLNEISRSETLLNQSNWIAENFNITNSAEYYYVEHLIFHEKNDDISALNSYLHGAYLTIQQNNQLITEKITDDSHYIWTNISRLSQWQQVQLQKLQAPLVNGWIELSLIANKISSKTPQTNELIRWQSTYKNHPANNIFPELLTPVQKTSELKNIAILIPLTGPQATIGKTVQEGILSAYTHDVIKENSNKYQLTFIDTNNVNFEELPQQLQLNETQYVIGPLLKKHVESYLAIAELSLPTLLLNVPEQPLQPHQIALSMRPEDEATQAASQLSQRNFKHPIVLSYDDRASLRIANAFSKQWFDLTNNTLEVTPFKQGQEMQTMIKEVLAIDKSQSRIKSLRSKFRESIKFEARNRRDIDMIYIVATPTQMRLLKPYIDVNISPFAKVIPVFSSSRSHSIQADKSTANDLRGLTFTQIPLLLESQTQNKELAQLNKLLWPKRNYNLQPIFAMGYDSLQLLNTLPQMQNRTYLRFSGQTGTLVLNEDNILIRSLTWGRYQNNKVSEVVME